MSIILEADGLYVISFLSMMHIDKSVLVDFSKEMMRMLWMPSK
jgi:hypothetical protein